MTHSPVMNHRVMKGAEPIFLQGKSDRALIGLHGLTGSPDDLREWAQVFHRLGDTISVPLLPGHGTSPEDLLHIEWDTWISAVRAEVRRLRKTHRTVILVGSSMGATIALQLANEESPREEEVSESGEARDHRRTHSVLGSPRPFVDAIVLASVPLVFRYHFLHRISLPILKLFVPMIKKRGNGDFTDPAFGESRVHYEKIPLAAIQELWRGNARVREDRNALCPVLVLHGNQDRVNAMRGARWVRKHVKAPWLWYKEYRGTAHHILADARRHDAYRDIGDFLDEVVLWSKDPSYHV